MGSKRLKEVYLREEGDVLETYKNKQFGEQQKGNEKYILIKVTKKNVKGNGNIFTI